MTDTLVFSDFMDDLRDFLRAHPLLADLSAGNVFFSLPKTAPSAPFIRLYQVGGGPQATEAGFDVPRVAHEVWGKQGSDYTAVRQTSLALKSIYQDANGEPMGTGSVLMNARVTSVADSPDPDTGWPRQVLDALLVVSLP